MCVCMYIYIYMDLIRTYMKLLHPFWLSFFVGAGKTAR